MQRMANGNKKQTLVMVGTRVPATEAKRYHAAAETEHRKLAEVIRKLLAEWERQTRAA